MEIQRVGGMKSEFRNPNSERNPKPEARSQRRSAGTLGSPGNTQEAREGICHPQRGTNGRQYFGFRISAFGFAQSLVSPKNSIYDG